VLLIAIEMIKFIIGVGVSTVSKKDVESKLLNPDGKLLDTRKNPPAIAVGLGPNMRLNSWCIMWMAT
jgi:hypothetical protein